MRRARGRRARCRVAAPRVGCRGAGSVRRARGPCLAPPFFTTGEQESRAWTVRTGSSAPQAAGTIHSPKA
ncbi:MAG: DUF933 domain-containing protein [Gemmatimonadales bacterium]|nr:DUF933 domain-containing protein [Gemmatimonadales bacterium]MBT3497475.1 DUF933 domain-containing protein [Gemmatimonadales bacterium]MBT3775117.1 DUF933 domain-containing protein [Gemmatimonadales bacterium]MBT4437587.1 DUF933 domain-containing protein [Gemmatimonadales bacterium]MBT5046560.1 DUF933 domain-containing protein [Gemmatimonadales bacterium]